MAKDRVEQSELTRSVEAALLRAGLNAADAWTCAETFVLQAMRGVGHHALDLLPDLIEGLTSGAINSNPHREVVSRFGATAVLDADGGPGIAACRQAMSLSLEAATEHGIGITLVRNSRHFLAGAPYCIAATEAGMIGAACTNAGASMAYPGTRSPMLSNGPIAYALPTGEGYPIVFDAAMTASGGQLIELASKGESLPEYLAGLDAGGRATRDPAAILHGGATLPIGMHKGSGLVLLIEVLTGLMSGGGYLLHSGGEGNDALSGAVSQCLLAINVEAFMPLPAFLDRTRAYGAGLKRAAEEEGSKITLPGERAHRAYGDCMSNGIPVRNKLKKVWQDVARMTGVSPPWATPGET